MRRRRRVPGISRDRGMTLIELIIVLAILSVTSDAIFSIMFASLKTYWKGDLATQVQQGARISSDRMVRDLRQAGSLIDGKTKTVGATTVNFNTSCGAAPQISFVLPHLTLITLSDGSPIYDTDANGSGVIPYDGWYVSYYLAASSNSATPNATGPFLIRASYDFAGNAITLATVANDITGLTLSAVGACPTTAAHEFTVTLTAHQQTGGQVTATGYQQSQTVITDDVALRNNFQ